MKDAPTAGNALVSWVVLLAIVFGLIAVAAAVLVQSMDLSTGAAVGWGTVLVVGFAGYFFAEEKVYDVASRKLGYRCEMRPQPKPHSARYDANLVITGSYRGHPFTLYRERHNSTSTSASSALRAASPILYSVVEWADDAFKDPPFSMAIGADRQAPADPFGIRSAMESAVSVVRGKSGAPAAEPAEAPPGFAPSKRDELDSIMGRGSVEGEPGYLVLRETPRFAVWTSRAGKFPYPWEIEAYLERADRVRRLFAA